MLKNSGINPTCYILDRQYKKQCEIRSKLFSERLANARNLYRKDLFAHYGCVNAIEFSNDGELLVSGGDDRRVLLWSMANAIHGKGSPIAMKTNHFSNIFCLDFDSKNSRIFSGGNDDQLLIHDIQTRLLVEKIDHKKPIYGLQVNPQNDDVVATAGEDGRILIYDLREASDSVLCLAKQKAAFHSVMYHPRNTNLLTTANAIDGIALWDSRKPKEQVLHYDSQAPGSASAISACFNSTGTQILALRRRLPPALYNTHQEENICQFYHPNYYNSCTMKTCCFVGENDEYVLSGSDDFNLYMWSVPKNNNTWGSTHLVLRGHRSIVNQVRYNSQNNIIATSGVEKMIKFWSSLPIGDWEGSFIDEMNQQGRSVYSQEEYIRLSGVTGERISHDYSEHSTLEDSRMLAFFDALIQREIEGWNSCYTSSNSDSDSDSSKNYSLMSKIMYVNSRNLNEDSKKPKRNRIEQLIDKRRNCLVKLAHSISIKSQRKHASKISNKKQCRSCKCNNTHQNNNNISKKLAKKECSRKNNSKNESAPMRRKLKKAKTKKNSPDVSNHFDTTIDTPSTSTGITNSHNNVFRVIEQDSEEDVPPNGCIESEIVQEENLISILPTPINGTQEMLIHTLTTHSNDASRSIGDAVMSQSTTGQNRYRYDSAVCIDGGIDRASSSNEAASSFPRSTFNGSFPPVELNEDNTDSDSDCDINYVTPIKKRCIVSDMDSGFATGPSSSINSYEKNSSNHQECSHDTSCSSDDELKYERFRKRLRKSRINNIRKNINEDSDSC